MTDGSVLERVSNALKNPQGKKLLHEWERKHKGEVDKRTFAKSLQNIGVDATGAELNELFATWDLDGGGSVGVKEIRIALIANVGGSPKPQRAEEHRKEESAAEAKKHPLYAVTMALLDASSNGDMARISQVVSGTHPACPKPHDVRAIVHHRTPGGITALHKAAMSGQTKAVMQALIQMGFDPNVMDDQERSPLMMAAINQNLSSVQALISIGVAGLQDGLRFAVMGGSLEVVKSLVDAIGDEPTPSSTGTDSAQPFPLPSWVTEKDDAGRDIISSAKSTGEADIIAYLEGRLKVIQEEAAAAKARAEEAKAAEALASRKRKTAKKIPRPEISSLALKRISALFQLEKGALSGAAERCGVPSIWDEQAERDTKVRVAFAIFDTDGSGALERNELRSIIALPTGGFPMLEAQLDAIFEEYDLDMDKALKFHEFDSWWSNLMGIPPRFNTQNSHESLHREGEPMSHLVWDARLGRRRPPLGLGE